MRKQVRFGANDACITEPPQDGSLVFRVSPRVDGLELAAWLRSNSDTIQERLLEYGAILFRGFGIDSPARFERVMMALTGELLDYQYRSTPRTRLSGNVFTSTEYPADRVIPLHNEMAYTASWPMKLWLCCVQPADRGGETPLADSRKVLARIPEDTRTRFAELGVMYVRNYGHGVDLPWDDVFQTKDPAEVERRCRDAGIDFEWKEDGTLTTRQVCQGIGRHPVTGAEVWFNQAHLFHISSLEAESRALLLENFDEKDLPRHAYYGDGSPIAPETVDEIQQAFAAEAVSFPWERGDVVLVDNMLVAHGRRSYEGARKIIVGMADAHEANRVAKVQ